MHRVTRREKQQWTDWLTHSRWDALAAWLQDGSNRQRIEGLHPVDRQWLQALGNVLPRGCKRVTGTFSPTLRSCIEDATPLVCRLLALAGQRPAGSDDAGLLLCMGMDLAPLNPDLVYAAAWWHDARGETRVALDLATQVCSLRADVAEHWAALAWFALSLGDEDCADQAIASALQCDRRMARAWWLLGALRKRQRRWPEARDALLMALQIDPNDVASIQTLGWLHFEAGQYDQAALWASRAMALDAGKAGFELAARVALQRRRFEDAQRFLTQALAYAPQDARLIGAMVMAYLGLGEPEKAWQTLQPALKNAPHVVDVTLALSAWHEHAGDLSLACGALEGLLRQGVDQIEVWRALARLYLRSRVWAQAAHCCQAWTRLAPHDAQAWLAWAQADLGRSQLRDALHKLDQSLQHNPLEAEARRMRVRLLLDLGQADRAHQEAVLALRRQRSDAALWVALGYSQVQRDRPGAAWRSAQIALRTQPGSADVWRLGVWAGLACGQVASACAMADRLLALQPRESADDIAASQAYARAGWLDRALICAQRAVVALPGRAQSHQALALVWQHSRQPWLALRAWQAACACADADAAVWHAAQDCAQSLGQAVPAWAMPKDVPGADSHAQDWRWAVQTAHRCGELDPAFMAWLADPARPRRAPTDICQAVEWVLDVDSTALAACWPVLMELAQVEAQRPRVLAVLWRLSAQGVALAQRALAQFGALDQQHALAHAFGRADLLEPPADRRQWVCAALAMEDASPRLQWQALQHAVQSQTMDRKDLLSRLRQWGLSLRSLTPWMPPAPVLAQSGLRSAWLLPPGQESAWLRVVEGLLGAHDSAVAYGLEVSDAAVRKSARVSVLPLEVSNWAQSLRALGIDWVVDLAGCSPQLDRFAVLQQLAQRPCAHAVVWGSPWLAATGIYDSLWIEDDAQCTEWTAELAMDVRPLAVGSWPVPSPVATAHPHQADDAAWIWAWLVAPDVCADAWWPWIAQLLAQARGSELRVFAQGQIGHAWRRGLITTAQAHGVDSSRIAFVEVGPGVACITDLAPVDAMLVPSANANMALISAALAHACPVVACAPSHGQEGYFSAFSHAIDMPVLDASTPQEWVALALRLYGDRAQRSGRRKTLQRALALRALDAGDRLAEAATPLLNAVRGVPGLMHSAWTPKVGWIAHMEAGWQSAKAARQPLDFRAQAPGRIDVSVVMVLFNQVAVSHAALQALADQRGVNLELIVIDNASTDATPDLLALLQGARVIRQTENLGFLRASNLGASVARGRHILLLNNDALVHRDALARAVRTLDAQPGVGAVGARIVLPSGRLQEAGCLCLRDGSTRGVGRGEDPLDNAFAFEREVDFCSGAFLLVRASAWRALGGFDVRYVPAYYEDTDLCLRLWAAGWSVVYAPSVWVTHLEGASASQDHVNRWIAQRRKIFVRRHRRFLQSRPRPFEVRLWRDRFHRTDVLRVLVIDNEVPHTRAGGGLPLARSVLQALAPFHVTFFPMWTVHDSWAAVYATLSPRVEVIQGAGAQGLAAFLRQRAGSFDAIWISRPPNMQVLRDVLQREPALLGGARLIYDAEAVFARRDVLKAQVQGRSLSRLTAARRVQRELALAAGADAVVSVSCDEAALFRDQGIKTVRILMHSQPLRRRVPAFSSRQGLLFVGSIAPDSPNEDSLVWFIESVMPRLRAYFDAPPLLTVVGECRSARVLSLAGPGWRWVGMQDDLAPWYDAARVFVAPTRFAAGVPVKVIEAAGNGVPVVATTLLAQQLGWDGQALSAADDPGDFARILAQLYRSPALWRRQQRAARDRLAQQADPIRFAQEVQDLVRTVCAPPTPKDAA
ncbi:MAG: hypothetical protein Fur007_08450 [Rhodoferax sp.]